MESAVGLHKNRNFSYGVYLAKSKHQDGSDWLGAPWEEETVDEYAKEFIYKAGSPSCS